jgi:hypothetical protein
MTKTTNKKVKEPSIYRRFKNAKGLSVGLGDLVEFKWNENHSPYKPIKLQGIIQGLPPDWYVINKHADILDCIVSFNDITKIIKRHAIDPKLIKYLHR